MSKYVFTFGNGKADGKADMKELLGGKGANLAEMTNLGISVPAGFTLSTEVCSHFYDHDKNYPPELEQQVLEALKNVEDMMAKKFGDSSRGFHARNDGDCSQRRAHFQDHTYFDR